MTDNEKKSNWIKGWPKKRGVYFARIADGPQVILVHHYCGDTGRHWWTDTSGYDVVKPVEYKLPAIAEQQR